MSVIIIGAGAWGSAIAKLIERNGNGPVQLCSRNSLEPTISEKELNIVFLAVPTQKTREALKHAFFFVKNIIIVSSAKGIEKSTGLLPSEIITSILPHCRIAAIAGPNFAGEIAAGKPAVTTIATANLEDYHLIAQLLVNKNFITTYQTEVKIIELMGAVKNIIAIGAAIADKVFGENAKAMVIWRGIEEIKILANYYKIEDDGFLSSPAGFADIFLTCSSTSSRNYRFGEAIVNSNIQSMDGVTVEGIDNAAAISAISRKNFLGLRIIEKIDEIITGHATPLTILE